MTPEPELKYRTHCRVCGHEFKNVPFVPYLGDGIDPRMLKMQQKLGEHMMCDAKHQFFSAMALATACFQFEDPHLNEFLGLVRFSVNQATRKNIATDEQIVERFAALGFTQEEISKLKPLVFDLRDFLCELNAHAPKVEQPASVTL